NHRRALMSDQVQWVIEGRDRGHDTDGLPGRGSPAVLCRIRQLHMDLAADEIAWFVCSAVNAVDGVGEWLAALTRDLHGEMVACLRSRGGQTNVLGPVLVLIDRKILKCP